MKKFIDFLEEEKKSPRPKKISLKKSDLHIGGMAFKAPHEGKK